MDKKWIIFGKPKQLLELVEKRNKELEKKKTVFLDKMKVAQENFKEDIDNIERTIMNFHTWQDIKNH